MDMPPIPEATITFKDGRIVYIRGIKDSDIDPMLGYLEKVMKVDKDFYDIVGVRVYGEVLALRRKRLKDPFTMVGLVDGEWLGFANGRALDKDIAISLHTLTFSRKARLGWPMYYAKTYYAMELLKVKEWWSTFEKATTAGVWQAFQWLSLPNPGQSTSTSWAAPRSSTLTRTMA